MLNLVLLYFGLFAFWVETVLGFSLSQIKGISLWNLSLFLMLLSLAVSTVKKGRFVIPNKVNKYILLLFVVVVASIPVKLAFGELKVDLFDELIAVKSWANPFILFFIALNLVDDEKTANGVLAGLVGFFGLTVVSSLLVSAGLLRVGVLEVMEEGRVAGFSEPNQYAAFLVLFIPLFASAVLFGRSRLIRFFSSAITLFSFMSLIATGSRGGAVCFLLSALIFVAVLYRRGMIGFVFTMTTVVVFSVMALGAFALVPESVKRLFQERMDVREARNMDEATSGRATLLRNGLELFGESPVFGHGQNSFLALSKKKFRVWGNSHNDFLLYLVHYGIIGLVVFVMILVKILQHVLQFMKATRDATAQRLYVSYLAGFLGFVMSMLSVNIMQPLYPFWVYTAFIIRYGQLDLGGELRRAPQGTLRRLRSFPLEIQGGIGGSAVR
jgi:hypothetical protein